MGPTVYWPCDPCLFPHLEREDDKAYTALRKHLAGCQAHGENSVNLLLLYLMLLPLELFSVFF